MEYTSTIERPEPTELDLVQESPQVKSYSAQIVYKGGNWVNVSDLLVIAGPREMFMAIDLAEAFISDGQEAFVNTVWCPADVRAEVFADDDEF